MWGEKLPLPEPPEPEKKTTWGKRASLARFPTSGAKEGGKGVTASEGPTLQPFKAQGSWAELETYHMKSLQQD